MSKGKNTIGRGGFHYVTLNPRCGKTKINYDELYPKFIFDEFITPFDNLPKQYIFNGNTTILIHNDKSKTIVKTMEGDEFDPVMGFLTAFFQKHSGLSKHKANEYLCEVKKKYEETVKPKVEKVTLSTSYGTFPVREEDIEIIEEEPVEEVINDCKFKSEDRVKLMVNCYGMLAGATGKIKFHDGSRMPGVFFDNGKHLYIPERNLELIESEEK